MIREFKTEYYAEWFDADDVVNIRHVGSCIEEAISETREIMLEEKVRPFIFQRVIEDTIIMQIKE